MRASQKQKPPAKRRVAIGMALCLATAGAQVVLPPEMNVTPAAEALVYNSGGYSPVCVRMGDTLQVPAPWGDFPEGVTFEEIFPGDGKYPEPNGYDVFETPQWVTVNRDGSLVVAPSYESGVWAKTFYAGVRFEGGGVYPGAITAEITVIDEDADYHACELGAGYDPLIVEVGGSKTTPIHFVDRTGETVAPRIRRGCVL